MFRKSAATVTERHTSPAEVRALKSRIAELESRVEELVVICDELETELLRKDEEADRMASRATSGFAQAWSTRNDVDDDDAGFFEQGQVDQRARRWLLDSKKKPAKS